MNKKTEEDYFHVPYIFDFVGLMKMIYSEKLDRSCNFI